MIRIDQLSHSYPGGTTVLSDINLSITRGTLLALVGTNGSGKSTLLSLLAGILRPTRGTISRGGFTSPGDEAAMRRSSGLLLQDADLQILGATVEEDILLGFATDDNVARTKALDMAQRFGLADQWHTPVQHLSWGQKRKLCLAAALLRQPDCLLLDEPFSGLDYPGMIEMREMLIASRSAGLTQVVTSHDLEPLADIVDVMAVMHAGRIALSGAPRDILDHVREFGVRPPSSWTANRTLQPWD
ncbi:biotin transport system ATP-binding protein [Desulfobaculum xiamenense]|uniref:Biotin transport system ATP-binding protein n=1 Tax=Desulfobaculum xiamenense TaxID=995050 RepID=A0A846QIY4_9BACT|nr:energy-coupling factor ABC transporter ATP-binding protein [Desulfobaculum xiamenense]NJB67007.1 biotin transport system ATP-binding protein [Desulfobaculum xiamenense]